jgi:hypothetical protein
MTNNVKNQSNDDQPESLDELRANLSKALILLTTAVDQSLKLSSADARKRPVAKEWEATANTFIEYVKSLARKDTQNLMSWFSMIKLKL